MKIEVIIPAYNEEAGIANVLQAIPRDSVERVIVVDNASTDRTAAIARENGAHVVHEPKRGYGQACLRGIAEATEADVLVFLDADFSDDPGILPELIAPIRTDGFDLVIGSRILGTSEPGALPSHARFGNILSCFLIRILFGTCFTDLGPFRAIRAESLKTLQMSDTNYGWTVEMQAKAARQGLRCTEIAVPYRNRIGRSKISGTIQGSVKAGVKILWTIALVWLKPSPNSGAG